MKNTVSPLVLAAMLGVAPAIAFAQDGIFAGGAAATDAVDDIEESVADDFERSTDRGTFGNAGRSLGWNGSIAATANSTSGNSDTVNVGIGTKFGYYDGTNGYDIALSYAYGEANGTTDANSFLGSFDYTRDLSPSLYGFGEIAVAYDEFSSFESDSFVGAGLGYRILADSRQSWDVQAAIGYRFLEDNAGVSTDEEAFKVGSKYLTQINDSVFLTNDTDILFSETNTFVTNDLGINVAMTDGLALRTSLLTEYDSDPLAGFKSTDNKLGVSVVYSFN
ncbi:MAG: DUF481 domain-containing protein [Pseudomonadota bacterium]